MNEISWNANAGMIGGEKKIDKLGVNDNLQRNVDSHDVRLAEQDSRVELIGEPDLGTGIRTYGRARRL